MVAANLRIWILFIVLSFRLDIISLQASPSEEHLFRRLQAHFILKDWNVGQQEAENNVMLYPDSPSFQIMNIRFLAELGMEKEMFKAWNNYVKRFPEKELDRELIEEMSWGVLKKASASSSLVTRQMSLLAAFFSQEGKGISILLRGMRDENYSIRAFAVKLAGRCRDKKLIDEMKLLFKKEKVWQVRKGTIEAIGTMKIRELKGDLEALLASDSSSPDEKRLAITSLLQLMEEKINRQELVRLSANNRAGMRLLACQAVAHFQLARDLDLLFKLAKDPHPDVKTAAFQAIGLVRPSEHMNEVISCAREGILNIHPQVSLSAAWLLTLYLPEEAKPSFTQFLYDSRQEVRILAASALRAAGHYGVSLALDHFRKHPDPFVRLNLALGLIDQRTAVDETCAYLKEMLKGNKDKWIEKETGLFQFITHNRMRKDRDSEGVVTSEMENQMLRIELLNLLTILNDTDALSTIRDYLLERSWGISATAAAALLIEGDEPAIGLVQDLLNDEQPKVRLQAALVLSLWGREETAIQALEEGYGTANHELKSRILEGLGRIGALRSIPFLIQTLNEPSQTLRVIAAMSLIQCLNH